jgi:hypothetical protein
VIDGLSMTFTDKVSSFIILFQIILLILPFSGIIIPLLVSMGSVFGECWRYTDNQVP